MQKRIESHVQVWVVEVGLKEEGKNGLKVGEKKEENKSVVSESKCV